MLRNGRLRQTQFFYQVTANTGIRLDDLLQNGDTRRVRYRF